MAVLRGDDVAIEFSPDGQRAAVIRRDSPSSQDLWVVDLIRGNMNRLTTDGLPRFTPHWSGDGDRIAYARQLGTKYDFYEIAANGVGGEQPLYQSSTSYKDFCDLSPDDSLVVFSDLGNRTSRDPYVVNLKSDRNPVPYLVTPLGEFQGKLSPDKHWMLYGSDGSGGDPRRDVECERTPARDVAPEGSGRGRPSTRPPALPVRDSRWRQPEADADAAEWVGGILGRK